MPTSIHGLSLPAETKITGRTSTIRGAFVKALIPEVPFTQSEVEAWTEMLELTLPVQCCYCGSAATELDHFFAAILDKTPTGYVSDLYNLVPACAKCNQSKGGKYWKNWITSSAAKAPRARGCSDLDSRVAILTRFEEWGRDKITRLPAETYQTGEVKAYLESCEALLKTFEQYQEVATKLKAEIGKQLFMTKTRPFAS